MSKNKIKTYIIRTVIIILGLISWVIILPYEIFWFYGGICSIPRKGDDLKRTYEIIESEDFIGSDMQYVDSQFPEIHCCYNAANCKVYHAGHTWTKFFFYDSKWYDLYVWYDDYGVVLRYEIEWCYYTT